MVGICALKYKKPDPLSECEGHFYESKKPEEKNVFIYINTNIFLNSENSCKIHDSFIKKKGLKKRKLNEYLFKISPKNAYS